MTSRLGSWSSCGRSLQLAAISKGNSPSCLAVPVFRCPAGRNRNSAKRLSTVQFGILRRNGWRNGQRQILIASGRSVQERSTEARIGIAIHCGGDGQDDNTDDFVTLGSRTHQLSNNVMFNDSNCQTSIAGSRTVSGHECDLSRTPEVHERGEARDTGAAFPSATSGKSTPLGVLLGGLVLALGFFGLRFGKPAYAEKLADPPTISTPLNADRDVEVSKSSETEVQPLDDAVASVKDESDSGAGEFEPPFGEGSDLTSDPAEILLRSYLGVHPEDTKALQVLLFQRLKKGEVNAALPVVKKLIELEPDNLEWKYVRAQADEYAGNLDQARQGFEEILKIKPFSARAWQGLAKIMHTTDEDEAALQLVAEAVKKAVDEGQAKEASNLKMLLGQLQTMQGNLEEAMELYRTVVEEDPQDYRPYLCQGLVFSILGEDKEAEKYFRQYRKLCPKDFQQRGFLDELMLKAKSESVQLKKRINEEKELKRKGQKVPKLMRQPLASGEAPTKEKQSKFETKDNPS